MTLNRPGHRFLNMFFLNTIFGIDVIKSALLLRDLKVENTNLIHSHVDYKDGLILETTLDYFHSSRDGKKLSKRSNQLWKDCYQIGPLQSFALDTFGNRMFKSTLKSNYNGRSFIVSMVDLTNLLDCNVGDMPYKVISLWNRPLDDDYDVNHTDFSMSFIGASLNIMVEVELKHIPTNTSEKFKVLLYFENYDQIGTTGVYPLVIKLTDVESKVSVVGENTFAILGTNNKMYKQSATQEWHYGSIDHLSRQVYSLDRGDYSAAHAQVDQSSFPSFHATYTLQHFDFSFYNSNLQKGFTYNFKSFQKSLQTIIVPPQSALDIKRHFYKNNFIDVSANGDSDISLYSEQGGLYFSTKKTSNMNSIIPSAWRNGELLLANGDVFYELQDSISLTNLEFENKFAINVDGTSISPVCSSTTSSTTFPLNFQNNFPSIPHYLLHLNGDTVVGLAYSTDESAIVPLKTTFTYNSGQFLYQIRAGLELKDIQYNFENKLAVALNKLMMNPNFSPVLISNAKMTIKNKCRIVEVPGTIDGDKLYFSFDSTLFKGFESTYDLELTANTKMCNEVIQSSKTMMGTEFIEPYLNSDVTTSFIGNALVVAMSPTFQLMHQDYKQRSFDIQFNATVKRCGADLLQSVVYDSINNRVTIPLDAKSVLINSRYLLKLVMKKDKCELTKTYEFTAGQNAFEIDNWSGNHSLANTNLLLNTSNYFNSFMNHTVDTLNALVTLVGCPDTVSYQTSWTNINYNGTIEIFLPPEYKLSNFYYEVSLSGQAGTCYFRSNAKEVYFSSINYKDKIFKDFNLNSSQLALSANGMTIDLSQNVKIVTQINYYLARRFDIYLSIEGLSFPASKYKETIYLNQPTAYRNNLAYFGNGGVVYSDCKRSFKVSLVANSTKCQMDPYNTTVSFGSSRLSLVPSQLFTVLNSKPMVSFDNATLAIPYNQQFSSSFLSFNFHLNASIEASTCSIKESYHSNTTQVVFPITDKYLNRFSYYTLNVQGKADDCEFYLQDFGFNAGELGSTDAVLQSLSLSKFKQESTFSISEPEYQLHLNDFPSTFTINKYLYVDQCTTAINPLTTDPYAFQLPMDYVNNTASMVLKTTISSTDCMFTTNHTFNTGYSPVIDIAYYNFKQIEIIGNHLGDSSSTCKRKREIKYLVGATTSIASVQSWTDTKIVLIATDNALKLELTIGTFNTTIDVVRPVFVVETFMNEHLVDKNQFISFKWTDTGLKTNDTWLLDSSNSLYELFPVKNGTLNDSIDLYCPMDILADQLPIHFTLTQYNIPGIVFLTIKKTPTLFGQSLSPTLQMGSTGYSFEFQLDQIIKYSYLDVPKLANQFSITRPLFNDLKFNPGSFRQSTYELVSNVLVTIPPKVGVLDFGNTSVVLGRIENDAFTFIPFKLKWELPINNTYKYRVGDLPLTMNITLLDIKGQSKAIFPIISSLICSATEFPNVFGGKDKDNMIQMCSKCPVGGICDPRGASVPKREKGYYKIENNGTYAFTNCFPAEACFAESRECSDGYVGENCGSCELNWYRSQNNSCLACGQTDIGLMVGFLFIFLFIFGVVVYVMMKMGRYFAAFAISINYFQILFIFKSIVFNWSKGVLEMFDALSIFSFNLELARPECLNPNINYFSKAQVMFLIVPVFFIVILVVALLNVPPFNYPALFIRSKVKNTKLILPEMTKLKIQTAVWNSIRTFHVILQFLYVSLCSWALGYFSCSSYGEPEDNKFVMRKSPGFFCYQDKHEENKPYFVLAVIFYVVGMPLYFSTLYFCMYQKRYSHPFMEKMRVLVPKLVISESSIFRKDVQFIITAQLLMKLVILLVQNFVYYSIAMQAVIIQIALFTYIGFLIYFKPYVERDHTLADIFCQICSVLTIGCGILFLTNNTEASKVDYTVQLTTLVFIITGSCVISSVVFVGRDIYRASKLLKIKLDKSDIVKERRASKQKRQSIAKSATIDLPIDEDKRFY